MIRYIIVLIARRWIRKAQCSFDSTPPSNDGLFCTAGFQSAAYRDLNIMPPTEFAKYLIRICDGEPASDRPKNAHWYYPKRKVSLEEHPACNDYLTEGTDA